MSMCNCVSDKKNLFNFKLKRGNFHKIVFTVNTIFPSVFFLFKEDKIRGGVEENFPMNKINKMFLK